MERRGKEERNKFNTTNSFFCYLTFLLLLLSSSFFLFFFFSSWAYAGAGVVVGGGAVVAAKVGKEDGQVQQLADGLEQLGMREHALLEARVEKVAVVVQHLVDGRHLPQTLLELVPVGLNHLHRHVVLVAVHKVQNPLPQRKRQRKP